MVNLQALGVVRASELQGEDAEDTLLLQQLLVKAHAYLRSYRWCHRIQESYFGLGVAGVVGVFLLRIVGGEGVDDWLWVVVGDLPSCYLVTDDAPDGVSALEVYCELMDDWIAWVRAGCVGKAVFPVDAPATEEAACALGSRLDCLRSTVIPAYKPQ
jgi:hypothetical protein